MSVTNGQIGNQDTFNNAFASKQGDNEMLGNQNLNDPDALAGTQVTNVQREHNSAASYIGKAINAIKNALPSWTSTAVGTGADDLTQRAEALTVASGVNAADIALRQLLSEKSQANGYASLDGTSKIPLVELPNSVVNARNYLGSWAASTNTPTLADGDTLQPGDEYSVSDDGTVDFGSGNIVFTQGDTVIYDGALWANIPGSAIDSVNGQQGTVVLSANDINDIDTSGVAAGDYLRKSGGDWLTFNPDQIVDDAATGSNQTLTAVTDKAAVRLTNAGLVSVDMVPATTNAQRFVLVNDTGGTISISNLTGATAADQIITGTGATLSLSDQASLFCVYDTTDAKWRVVGGSGAGGGLPTFSSTTDNSVMRSDGITGSAVQDSPTVTINDTGNMGIGTAAVTDVPLSLRATVSGNTSIQTWTDVDGNDTWNWSVFQNGALNLLKSGQTWFAMTIDAQAGVAIGSSGAGGTSLYVKRAADQIQLRVGTHSTQTGPAIQVVDPSLVEQASISGTGAGSFSQLNTTAQGEVRFQDSAGGEYMGLRAPVTVTTSTTLTLPDGAGANGEVLTTNGTDTLSWTPAGGGDLWSDPVDANIIPDGNNTRDLGSSANNFANVYSNSADLKLSVNSSFNDVWGNELPGLVLDGTTSDATTAGGTGILFEGSGSDGSLVLLTADQSGSAPSADFYISSGFNSGTGNTGGYSYYTGDQTGSAGNTGGFQFSTGASTNGNSGGFSIDIGNASGTKGKIRLRDGSQGTIGHVLTSTGVLGEASWAASGGANTTLSNLGVTSINANLIPDGSNTRDIGASGSEFANTYTDQIWGIGGCGTVSIDVSNGRLNDDSSVISLDWFNRQMVSQSGSIVGRWTNAEWLELRGKFGILRTITAGATTGNQTIDRSNGSVNFAAAATALTVTCAHCDANSNVMATIQTNDANAPYIQSVVPAAGSFTINLSTGPAAEMKVAFFVLNNGA